MPSKKPVLATTTVAASATTTPVTTAPPNDGDTLTSPPVGETAAVADPGVDASVLVDSVDPPAICDPDCCCENRQRKLDELLDAAKTLTDMFMPNATAAMDPDAPNVIMVKAGLLGRQRAFVIVEMQHAVERLNAAVAAASG